MSGFASENIFMYPCLELDGHSMNLIDAPGVGEHGISPDDLAMIQEFVSEHVPSGIRAAVVTLRDARIELSNQIVQLNDSITWLYYYSLYYC